MHIFLTGEKQVGKSTIIRRYLELTGISADGFVTFWESDGSGAGGLYLSRYSPDSVPPENHLIAVKGARRLAPVEGYTRVFDVFGREILDNSGKRGLVVMDELGFLESEAQDFQRAVMRHIDGGVPILGVIRPKRTGFLDGVRAHPNVVIREVTPENRDEVLEWLCACTDWDSDH